MVNFCSNCGKEVKNDSNFCENCGYQLKETEAEAEAKNVNKASEQPTGSKGLAIAGMVFGVLGLSLCVSFILIPYIQFLPLLLSLLGFIFSISSHRRIGFRTAGLVTSIIGLSMEILILMVLLAELLASEL